MLTRLLANPIIQLQTLPLEAFNTDPEQNLFNATSNIDLFDLLNGLHQQSLQLRFSGAKQVRSATEIEIEIRKFKEAIKGKTTSEVCSNSQSFLDISQYVSEDIESLIRMVAQEEKLEIRQENEKYIRCIKVLSSSLPLNKTRQQLHFYKDEKRVRVDSDKFRYSAIFFARSFSCQGLSLLKEFRVHTQREQELEIEDLLAYDWAALCRFSQQIKQWAIQTINMVEKEAKPHVINCLLHSAHFAHMAGDGLTSKYIFEGVLEASEGGVQTPVDPNICEVLIALSVNQRFGFSEGAALKGPALIDFSHEIDALCLLRREIHAVKQKLRQQLTSVDFKGSQESLDSGIGSSPESSPQVKQRRNRGQKSYFGTLSQEVAFRKFQSELEAKEAQFQLRFNIMERAVADVTKNFKLLSPKHNQSCKDMESFLNEACCLPLPIEGEATVDECNEDEGISHF